MILDEFKPYNLKYYDIQTCVVDSQFLRKNPLGDTSTRANLILVPRNKTKNFKVIFVLAGFGGDGAKYFSFKSFDNHFVHDIDELTAQGQAPEALYVFVNAWTFWGGSQFINSEGCGAYEDYIIRELVPEIKSHYPCNESCHEWYLLGGSSGGYGALHLGSKYPGLFANIYALAPDSFFDLSLLPEIYHSLPIIEELGGIEQIKKKFLAKELKSSTCFKIFNPIAMAHCYGDFKDGEPIFPVQSNGDVDLDVWENWLKFDPIYFLNQRKSSLKDLRPLYISTGVYDEYGLQYGSRKIVHLLKKLDIKVKYEEFKGSHKDLSQARLRALSEMI